jgi:hypothetical protein
VAFDHPGALRTSRFFRHSRADSNQNAALHDDVDDGVESARRIERTNGAKHQ